MTSEIMDHEHSLLWDGAENRLYGEMAILVYLLYHDMKRPSEDLKAMEKAKIEAWISENM